MVRTRPGRVFQSIGAFFGFLVLVGCQPPPLDQNGHLPDARAAVGRITAARLSSHIETLAGDDYEGRGPATAADLRTQQYLADELAEMGLEPGGPDGSWVQEFDIVGITGKVPEQWSFQRGEETLSFEYWEQFIASSGVQRATSKVDSAEVVFVGYGIEAPEYQWNDFKGQDLSGKVLLIVNNDPDWDPELFAGDTRLYYGRWDYKYATAARQGAVGAIVIHTVPSAGYPWQVVQTSWSGEHLNGGGAPRDRGVGHRGCGSRTRAARWTKSGRARGIGEEPRFSAGASGRDDLADASEPIGSGSHSQRDRSVAGQ